MTTLVKYPRSPHLPWSLGRSDDDKVISSQNLTHLKNCNDLVVTEKMDGGNLTFYRDAFHGRSLTSGTHHWDSAAKALWATMHHDIPEGFRISGESLYARRSVAYENLPGPFMVFGIWDSENMLLGWDETREYAELLGLPTVPVLYRGGSFEDAVAAWAEDHHEETSEGFVVRNADAFHYDDFQKNLAKFVRKDHVRTRADWRHRDDYALNGFASW